MKVKKLYLKVKNKSVYLKIFEEDANAPNIIFIMTPIMSVDEPFTLSFLDGLLNKGCNIFAIDFLGLGKSEGNASDISFDNMAAALTALINYINSNYSNSIHIYGGTGTGGIIGQALCSDTAISPKITSYMQYGVANYKDLSMMGNTFLLRLVYPVIKLMNFTHPDKRMKFKIPKYCGYNAEKENQWYKDVMKKHPGAFDFSYSMLYTLLKLFFDKDSNLRSKPDCPVMVLAPKYDRYYSETYVNKYYNSLNNLKKIIWFDDSHLAFYWNAELINNKVIDWVKSF